jgi:hypothetical protein
MDITKRPVWPASDLARRRTDILEEAQRSIAFVKGTDGTLLAFTSAATLANIEDVQRNSQLLSWAVTAIVDDGAGPASLGDLAFISGWSPNRKRQFVEELNDVIVHSTSTGEPAEVQVFLQLSKPRPRSGVIDPERIRAALRHEVTA